MAKAIQRIDWDGPADDDSVDAFLKAKSISDGGAWFARGVFGKVTIYQFRNVSSIPDEFAGKWPQPQIWKGGKVVGFTKAQRIREQNRGVSDS